MEIWQIFLLVFGAIVLLLVFGYTVVKTIIDGIFSRRERPEYIAHLQFKDIAKECMPEMISFSSGNNKLQGYLFGKENTRGLVVVVHGLGGGAEGYLPEILYFAEQGYRVFAYDNTGYHLSEGKNSVGLPQAVEDLDSALTFAEGEPRFAELPVYLYGHSWGGYAVTAVLNFNHKVTAVASVSGFGNANKMIKEWARRMVGKWSVLVNPFLVLHQRLHFGKKLDIMSVDGINKADIPVFLAHGSKDATVRMDGSALISCKNEITNQKVQYVLWDKEGQNGHLDILYDVSANEYSKQVSKEYERLMKLTKKKPAKEDKEEFFANVDKVRSSLCNKELMAKIVEFYEGK
ncbi:MAG: alpha/beta fold hydrolase [Lachnospiraceae bacterium]|nr:alpha/beta fold hydrolase [Lachnospiraceae bacterium]